MFTINLYIATIVTISWFQFLNVTSCPNQVSAIIDADWVYRGGPFQYKKHYSRKWDSHYNDKTVLHFCCLYHGNSYTVNMTSLYWNNPHVYDDTWALIQHKDAIFSHQSVQLLSRSGTHRWKNIDAWSSNKLQRLDLTYSIIIPFKMFLFVIFKV